MQDCFSPWSENTQPCRLQVSPKPRQAELISSRLVTHELETDLTENADMEEPAEASVNLAIEPSPSHCDDDCALLNHIRHVYVIQSPYLYVFYNSHRIKLILDIGATSNMVSVPCAQRLGLPISKASQFARHDDGVTPIVVTRKVHCVVTRNGESFQLDALVVNQLDVDVSAGNPFLL